MSSTIFSSLPLFSHLSTSIFQTPYQLPPVGPTCQPIFILGQPLFPPTSFLANSAGAGYVRRPSLPALSSEQEKEPEAAAQPQAPRRGPDSTSPARRSSSPAWRGLELLGVVSSSAGDAEQEHEGELDRPGAAVADALCCTSPSSLAVPLLLQVLQRSSHLRPLLHRPRHLRRRGIWRPGGEPGAAAGNSTQDLRAPCSGCPRRTRGQAGGDRAPGHGGPV
jgi:hypothetical protein